MRRPSPAPAGKGGPCSWWWIVGRGRARAPRPPPPLDETLGVVTVLVAAPVFGLPAAGGFGFPRFEPPAFGLPDFWDTVGVVEVTLLVLIVMNDAYVRRRPNSFRSCGPP